MAAALGGGHIAIEAPFLVPALLDVTLLSGWRVITRQDANGTWWTVASRPEGRPGRVSFCRRTREEDTARADHAAFAGEFGP